MVGDNKTTMISTDPSEWESCLGNGKIEPSPSCFGEDSLSWWRMGALGGQVLPA